MALERARVDDDDRLAGVEGALDVGDRDRARARERLRRAESRHLRDDHVPGAEAVAPVVRRGADRLAEAVLRHPVVTQREPLAGRAGGIGAREVVVGPRIQARRRVERIAGERGAGRQQDERGSHRCDEHPCPHGREVLPARDVTRAG